MHQTHNIAWDSLSSSLVYIHENPKITPHKTDLFPRDLPSQRASLSHFARTVASTIRLFSDTERVKHPAKYKASAEGPIFSNAVIERYFDLPWSPITEKTQLIENWCFSRRTSWAQHPRLPLRRLHSVVWGYGLNHVRAWALQAYIFFNVLLSKPELHADGRYKSMSGYTWVISMLAGSGLDYDAHAYPHREFLLGTKYKSLNPLVDAIDPLQVCNLGKLKNYLKMCFRLLYQYDVLARECGLSVDWETEIVCTVRDIWKVKVENEQDGQGHWVTRFA
ncbi:hypothetical protein GGX14DRAFT_597128 [Mycena pura]|uniref:Uncharacterized protein n=1 Tax=Mycena pura TaxID=153505 RepID=A0AAD6UPJ5_9AGAR|nr:hypothetical protein GGX14DRAFT_597128 [Mycena pura]